MEQVMLWSIGQVVGFILLLRYMHVQIRDNKTAVDEAVKNTYTKEETDKLIDLKLKPYEVGLVNVQNDLTEIKAMLSKLLDAKIH